MKSMFTSQRLSSETKNDSHAEFQEETRFPSWICLCRETRSLPHEALGTTVCMMLTSNLIPPLTCQARTPCASPSPPLAASGRCHARDLGAWLKSIALTKGTLLDPLHEVCGEARDLVAQALRGDRSDLLGDLLVHPGLGHEGCGHQPLWDKR